MLPALATPPSTMPPRVRFTRADFAALESSGIVDLHKFELIEGDLLQKMAKNWLHSYCVMMLAHWLNLAFRAKHVFQETPINVALEDNPTSEPEPDLFVLTRPAEPHGSKPSPAELHLVIEVSDSTLAFDTTVKAGLYARAGIPEYWVVDVNGRRIGVHREPSGGVWQSITWHGVGEHVSPLAAPDARLDVGSPFAP